MFNRTNNDFYLNLKKCLISLKKVNLTLACSISFLRLIIRLWSFFHLQKDLIAFLVKKGWVMLSRQPCS